MQTELSDAVLTALNDVALDYNIGDEELIHLIAASLGRLIVHACEDEPERMEELVRDAIRQLSNTIKETEV